MSYFRRLLIFTMSFGAIVPEANASLRLASM
jgi:hypothetical protein